MRIALWSVMIAPGLAYGDGPWSGPMARLLGPPKPSPIVHAPTDAGMETLAQAIDALEHDLQQWGSVAPKAPDVWGQARLTIHRQQIEEQLAGRLGKFDFNQLNGMEVVSDQAFLALAAAMSAQGPGGNTAPAVSVAAVGINAEGKPEVSAPFGALPNPAVLKPEIFGKEAVIRVEQNRQLDQFYSYLQHLTELRRLNEGDDTADAPGYALNLVRIPVSILPGSKTRAGHGAEITFTAHPYLGPELLPTAFADLAANDLLDQISIPLTNFVNDDPQDAQDRVDAINARIGLAELEVGLSRILRPGFTLLVKGEKPLNPTESLIYFRADGSWTGCLPGWREMRHFLKEVKIFRDHRVAIRLPANPESDRGTLEVRTSSDDVKEQVRAAVDQEMRNLFESASQARQVIRPLERSDSIAMDDFQDLQVPRTSPARAAAPGYGQAVMPFGTDLKTCAKAGQGSLIYDQLINNVDKLSSDVDGFYNKIDGVLKRSLITPATSGRRATLPFPPSQIIDNFGDLEMGLLARDIVQALRRSLPDRAVLHVTDVRAVLREEIGAAAGMLRGEAAIIFWARESTGERHLVTLIQQRRLEEINAYRTEFLAALHPDGWRNKTAVLAWCLFVDSLLLNERLIDDMRTTAGSTQRACPCGQWMPYFLPDPPYEARMAFCEYVRCRWPLRVFALDPALDEQNIGTINSQLRQMQLAIAVGVASGRISASGAMRALRQIQRDRATIDLNRTQIAFGHGSDTFGWRFTPRFQTPPVESNLTTFFRDNLLGGPTDRQIDRSEKLEPGMRECTAIVLMPSFVPHLIVESDSRWFCLTKPSVSAPTTTEALRFSRDVTTMRRIAETCIRCPHLYREGEVDRLMTRVTQIDRRLPTQTFDCQVPIENVHGGFELFAAGTRELAPELLGWYGVPGYKPGSTCDVFLVGENFSVVGTKVIVGNKVVEPKLLSREVLQITIPSDALTVKDSKLAHSGNTLYDSYVDVHLATPYGVSGSILVPVLGEAPRPASGLQLVQSGSLKFELQVPSPEMSGMASCLPKGYFVATGTPPNIPWPTIEVPVSQAATYRAATIIYTLRWGGHTLPPVIVTGMSPQMVGSKMVLGPAGTQLAEANVASQLTESAMMLASIVQPHLDRPAEFTLDLGAVVVTTTKDQQAYVSVATGRPAPTVGLTVTAIAPPPMRDVIIGVAPAIPMYVPGSQRTDCGSCGLTRLPPCQVVPLPAPGIPIAMPPGSVSCPTCANSASPRSTTSTDASQPLEPTPAMPHGGDGPGDGPTGDPQRQKDRSPPEEIPAPDAPNQGDSASPTALKPVGLSRSEIERIWLDRIGQMPRPHADSSSHAPSLDSLLQPVR